MTRNKPIVAIDGPAGAGKSSVASNLAKRLGFLYIDTGAMYRTVSLKALREKLDLQDKESVAALAVETQIRLERSSQGLKVYCDGQEVTEAIRTPEVSAATSPVADNPKVRSHLVSLQQEMGRNGGVVMEGRDITTVVFPDAEIQIYLDAKAEIRAERRYKEMIAKGKDDNYEQILADLNERDRRDRERPAGALTIAESAMTVDTTALNQEEVIEKLFNIVNDWMTENASPLPLGEG